MSQPDLFVVCKNCGSEVSPYVTECPYCGQRVRKRAPKLEPRSAEDDQLRAKKRKRPKLSRLRANEIEGIAPDSRPTATIAVIVLSLLATLVYATGSIDLVDLGVVLSGDEQPWRYVTAPFVHGTSLGYAFVALTAVGVFGSMVERRFGWLLFGLVFLAAATAGVAAAVALESAGGVFEVNLVHGANGGALGLLAAWLVDDRRAARAQDDRGNDLVGVYVFAVVLLLLPLAVPGANAVAGVTGALVGALAGLVLPVLTRR